MVKVFWLAGFIQLLSFLSIYFLIPSWFNPCLLGGFIVWGSLQLNYIYITFKLKKEMNNIWKHCDWNKAEELYRRQNEESIDWECEEESDINLLEERMEEYKKKGEEYSKQYKEGLAKELERTGLSEEEYFQQTFNINTEPPKDENESVS